MKGIFGLKVWSENLNYIEPARLLLEEKVCDYIEIYALPETTDNTIKLWKRLNTEFIVHAPHFMHGINFSDSSKFQSNMSMAKSALLFADKLNAEKIIFHPGIQGNYKETARQMAHLRDKRVLVENKPYKVCGLNDGDICVGWSPEEISYILANTNIGFCLDIGHAICAANGVGRNRLQFLKDLLGLSPAMFHLSDGDWNGAIDKHLNIGHGSFKFDEIFALLPNNPIISIETEKSSTTNLDDFKKDVCNLKKYAENRHSAYHKSVSYQ